MYLPKNRLHNIREDDFGYDVEARINDVVILNCVYTLVCDYPDNLFGYGKQGNTIHPLRHHRFVVNLGIHINRHLRLPNDYQHWPTWFDPTTKGPAPYDQDIVDRWYRDELSSILEQHMKTNRI